MDTVMTRFGRGTLRATSHSRHPILSNAGDSCCRMFISEPCILNLCEVTSPKFSGIPLLEFSASYDARGLVGLSAGVDPAGLCAICREGREVRELAFQLAQQLVSFRRLSLCVFGFRNVRARHAAARVAACLAGSLATS